MDILNYESKIWESADLLIAAGVKQSDFPNYMMPFFALRLVESRLLRKRKELMKENDVDDEHIDEILSFFDVTSGYNEVLIKDGIKLADIVLSPSFDTDFNKYLNAFDQETRHLLGCNVRNDDEKFLNLSGIISELKGKKILFDYVSVWAQIDLEPFNNSEITTLEEHIKRRWADLSAATAGEQYTPDDIIDLISEIVIDKANYTDGQFVHIYDPTCGGGNLLFGIEDKIKEHFNGRVFTATNGMDLNSQLYALSKIESQFREDSRIEYGNTLIDTYFGDEKFDVVVANPPYGLTWKGFKKGIENDMSGRFPFLPAVSDSQMLFDEHIAHYMKDDGIAVIVNNGSPLFSGDAGSGESEIRKYFFENDWVEALIQMPANEFFNTGIYTYLWVLNKNKPAERKDKVILINGSNLFDVLKKSKGDKRNTMNEEHRALIVKTLRDFKDSDISKVFDKWFCYYNKFNISLFAVDDNNKAYCDYDEEKVWNGTKEAVALKTKLDAAQFWADNQTIVGDIYNPDVKKYATVEEYLQQVIMPILTSPKLSVGTDKAIYKYDETNHSLIKEEYDEAYNKVGESLLGNGSITYKLSYKKATKKIKKVTEVVDGKKVKKDVEEFTPAHYSISFYLESNTENDYELVPFCPVEETNRNNIAEFMNKYVFRPWAYRGTVIGTEINFNKVFYVPEVLRPADEILADVQSLDKELSELENSFSL
jgi:type I restriction enzyme M protein